MTARRLDVLLALALTVALELELRDQAGHRGLTVLAAVLVAGPIAVRRRFPAGALVFSSAAALGQALLGGHLSAANGVVLPPLLLAYGAGAWLELRRSAAALAAAGLLFSGFGAATGVGAGAGAAAVILFFVLPWLVGRAVRRSNARSAGFAELARHSAAIADAQERTAIDEERARIGSELEDVIAHSVTAMVVQAAAARRSLERDPGQARVAILTVEETGREALADLRRLLGMLRAEDDPRALSPQPGLGQLEQLVESLERSGVTCTVERRGEPVELTPGTDLVAYRLIEAALGWAAAGQSAAASVRYLPGELQLEVRGDVPLGTADGDLAVLSERVALYGGRLVAAPEDGGFCVRATLPLRAAVPA